MFWFALSVECIAATTSVYTFVIGIDPAETKINFPWNMTVSVLAIVCVKDKFDSTISWGWLNSSSGQKCCVNGGPYLNSSRGIFHTWGV